jgi:hypothetical protein
MHCPLLYSGANGGSEKGLINGQSQQRPVYLTATWVRGWLCLVYACIQIVTELAICVSLAHHRCPWGGGVVSQLSGHWNAESRKDTEVPSLPGVTRHPVWRGKGLCGLPRAFQAGLHPGKGSCSGTGVWLDSKAVFSLCLALVGPIPSTK